MTYTVTANERDQVTSLKSAAGTKVTGQAGQEAHDVLLREGALMVEGRRFKKGGAWYVYQV